jgi:phosphatidylglycerol:prolipoprotein diacylglycerol transferase
MALGLAFGRIGCLMNGCCYGGPCSLPWAVSFPAGERGNYGPPYERQLETGLLFGFELDRSSDAGNSEVGGRAGAAPVIRRVLPDSPASEAGFTPGESITWIGAVRVETARDAARQLLAAGGPLRIETDRGHVLETGPLPTASLPIHPTQIYSAIHAALLCLFLLAYTPFRTRDGQVFAMMLTIYPITRFLIEIIRTDESAIFGTGLSISQNVSILMLVAAAGLWAYLLAKGPGIAWPAAPAAGFIPIGRPPVGTSATAERP